LQQRIVSDEDFVRGRLSTAFMERRLARDEAGAANAPAASPAATAEEPAKTADAES
jgi:hypothetical protein